MYLAYVNIIQYTKYAAEVQIIPKKPKIKLIKLLITLIKLEFKVLPGAPKVFVIFDLYSVQMLMIYVSMLLVH